VPARRALVERQRAFIEHDHSLALLAERLMAKMRAR
jgi:hypothetical protein